MGLVRIWTRQVARAAGASLIAPLALLLTAAVVASGGGFGGIGTLGQIASGPPLPDIGLASAPPSALDGADIVGADVPEPGVPSPRALPTGPVASASPTSRVAGANGGALPPGSRGPRQPAERVRPPKPPAARGEDGAPLPRAPSAPKTPAPNPVDDLLDATRGVGGSLPGPLGPITSDILNLLLGPPRP